MSALIPRTKMEWQLGFLSSGYKGEATGAIAPPLAGRRKKYQGKINENKTKKGPFQTTVDEIRGLFKNGHRLVSESCNFCRILNYIDDQA